MNNAKNPIIVKMIDILIPTYNRKKFLRQAIDSLLLQNYDDFKIVVYDDGSKRM